MQIKRSCTLFGTGCVDCTDKYRRVRIGFMELRPNDRITHQTLYRADKSVSLLTENSEELLNRWDKWKGLTLILGYSLCLSDTRDNFILKPIEWQWTKGNGKRARLFYNSWWSSHRWITPLKLLNLYQNEADFEYLNLFLDWMIFYKDPDNKWRPETPINRCNENRDIRLHLILQISPNLVIKRTRTSLCPSDSW